MSKRPSLILVPGLACTSDLWRDQVRDLADMAVVKVPREHLLHPSVGAIARAILRTAPDRFALAGLSMGGYIVLEMMRQEPERVTRLALLDTSARPDTTDQTSRRRALIAVARAEGMRAVIEQLLPLMIHPSRLNDPELTARMVSMGEECGVEAFVRQQQAIMARPDSRGDLSKIACSTLVVCGEEDRITLPEWSHEIAAGVPGARLAMIARCGHMSSMERPTDVSGLLKDLVSGL